MAPETETGGDVRVLLLYTAQKQEQSVKQSRQKHSAAFKAKVALAAIKGGLANWPASMVSIPARSMPGRRRCSTARVRERQRSGRQDQRIPGRRTLPPDRPAEGRK